MHHTIFEYLRPTDAQSAHMNRVRLAFAAFASVLNAELPEGPDKTYIMRKLRECSMWSNMAIMRLPDGTPRDEAGDKPGPQMAYGQGHHHG